MLRQLRRKRLYGKDGTVVELSLDDVEVALGGRVVERFAELEAEVREGDEAVLEPLVELLERDRGAGAGRVRRSWSARWRPCAASARPRPTAAPRTTMRPRDGRAGRARGRAARRRGRRVAAEPSIEEELAVGLEAPDEEPVEDDDTPRTTTGIRSPRARGRPRAPGGARGRGQTRARRPPPWRHGPARAGGGTEGGADPEARPRLTAGKTPGVLADDHLAEAGRKVLRFHLARMVAREAGHPRGQGQRGAPRDARRDPPPAGGVAGVRRRVRPEADRCATSSRLKEVARDLGAVRDLDVLIEAGEDYQKKLARGGPAGVRAAARQVARASATPRASCSSRSSTRPATALARRVHRVRRRRRASAARLGRAGRSAPRPGHDAVAHLGGVRGRPRLRAGHALGRRHHAPRPADRREVAALHAGVRARGARARRRRRSSSRSSRSRTTSAGSTTRTWPRGSRAGSSSSTPATCPRRRARAIGRYLVDRERELARLRRTVGPAWRGVSSVGVPARARTGRRRALARLGPPGPRRRWRR